MELGRRGLLRVRGRLARNGAYEMMFYLSHAWARGRKSCEIFVRLHDGKRPSAGETVLVQAEGEPLPMPLTVTESRWQDEDTRGVLVLAVSADQAAVVEKLTADASIWRRPSFS